MNVEQNFGRKKFLMYLATSDSARSRLIESSVYAIERLD